MDRSTTYADANGVERTAKVTVSTIERVRDVLGIDLLNSDEGKSLQRALSDPLGVVRLLHVGIAPQEQWEAFEDGHTGDAIAAGVAAFREALIRFFTPEKQRLMREAMRRADAATDRLLAAMERGLETGELIDFDGLMVKELPPNLARLVSTSADGSGGPPASSPSTPAPAP